MFVVAGLSLKGHCMGRPIKWYRHMLSFIFQSDESFPYKVVDVILSSEHRPGKINNRSIIVQWLFRTAPAQSRVQYWRNLKIL